MLETHREAGTHGGYTLYLRDPGFEFTPVMLAKVASFIVQGEDGGWTVAAFMYSLLSRLDGHEIEEAALLDAAVETIKEKIDAGEIEPRTDLTFEYREGGFREVISPRWWITTHR